MLRRLSLSRLVDGESTPFPIEIESTKTIGDLKDSVKAALSPQFDDVTAKDLTIWSVSIPVSDDDDDDDDEIPMVLDNVNSKDKKKLRAMRGLLEVFPDKPPKNTIHVIVQRPPQGDLHADINRITDKFFAPGLKNGICQESKDRAEEHPKRREYIHYSIGHRAVTYKDYGAIQEYNRNRNSNSNNSNIQSNIQSNIHYSSNND
ncbi:hypothetical protein KI688_002269 [Linnemannia hyalina]|uniref:Crinkler effector protein N-terminal domain-containing protein n=1 Tax=Linnemannia hyalina TaxID=64524 RepID=A0A9P7XRW2_9FUNG|nr:hypothetical protein KI688_002269 [Linnemannia hyalina]